MSTTTPRRHFGPFVALEVATLLSATGNGIAMIALPWLVLELTGKASDAGLVAAAGVLPLLATALFAGTVVDRVGRRRTAVFSEGLSALSVAAIPVVGAFGNLTLTWLMALAALGAFFDPAGATARLDHAPGRRRAGGTSARASQRHPRGVVQHCLPDRPRRRRSAHRPGRAEATLWATAAAFLAAGVTMLFVRVPGGSAPTNLEQREGFWAETVEGPALCLERPRAAHPRLHLPRRGRFVAADRGRGPARPLPVRGPPQALGLLLTAMSARLVVGTLGYGLVGHRVHRRTAILVALERHGAAAHRDGDRAGPALDAGSRLPQRTALRTGQPDHQRGHAGALSRAHARPCARRLHLLGLRRRSARPAARRGRSWTSSASRPRSWRSRWPSPSWDSRTIALPGLRDLDTPRSGAAEVRPHVEPPRGRGKGDGKPPAGRPISRHDSPNPASAPTHGPRRSDREKRRSRGGSADTTGLTSRQDGGVEPATPPDETVAARILDLLGAAGVRTAFGLPGVHNLPFWRCAPGGGRPRILRSGTSRPPPTPPTAWPAPPAGSASR